eukprot:TRINITY_DN10084_c0_g1_i1.p1 TRINITY_DN10084_c0_g1~~TRINITY_DN10084_c0_g1_i1.p1  ORF type:complete len:534 (+),score=135.33 TRINITY_DN10084_c0_g1_i1:94-1602(+)
MAPVQPSAARDLRLQRAGEVPQRGNSERVTGSDSAPGGVRGARTEVWIRGLRVDVTDWARRHPGGSKVFRIFADRDATEVFESYHSRDAHKTLDKMLKGAPPVPAGAPQPHMSAIGRDFARLTDQMRSEGLFTPCWRDEVSKVLWVLLPWMVGAALVYSGALPLAGTLLFALGSYLSGWVSHDWLHHSAAKTTEQWGTDPAAKGNGVSRVHVWWGDVIGYLLGWVQGYEELWWKARHNTHHVCTNEHKADPDIRTSPVLVYVRNDPRIAKALNAVQRWQQWYYLPVFLIFDLYWRLESLAYLLMRLPRPRMVARLALLAAHYVFLYHVFAHHWRLLILFSALRGFLTGVVVFSTHYGEDILSQGDARVMTLAEQTSRTSCNIAGGRLVNFLTGCISLQTEHHRCMLVARRTLTPGWLHADASVAHDAHRPPREGAGARAALLPRAWARVPRGVHCGLRPAQRARPRVGAPRVRLPAPEYPARGVLRARSLSLLSPSRSQSVL